jgi:membrane-associated phospholipid phosphatase
VLSVAKTNFKLKTSNKIKCEVFSMFEAMYFQNLLRLLKENRLYYFSYLFLFLAGIIIQLRYSQFDITIAINGWHSIFLDIVFKYLTDLGDAMFATAAVVVLLLYRRKYWLSAAVCFSLAGMLAQIGKRLLFTNHLRPSILMKDISSLHYVEDVFMNELHSFPSGHTTSAFAVFTFFAIISSNKKYNLMFLLLALFTGISRIYLLQHFFQDVLAGSIIGVVVTTLVFPAFETFSNSNHK